MTLNPPAHICGSAKPRCVVGRIVTRRTDNLHLRLVQLRAEGVSAADIAFLYGLKPERVRVVTNRILDDDRKHSGENINASYWRAA